MRLAGWHQPSCRRERRGDAHPPASLVPNQYRHLHRLREALHDVPFMALTATATPKVTEAAAERLASPALLLSFLPCQCCLACSQCCGLARSVKTSWQTCA